MKSQKSKPKKKRAKKPAAATKEAPKKEPELPTPEPEPESKKKKKKKNNKKQAPAPKSTPAPPAVTTQEEEENDDDDDDDDELAMLLNKKQLAKTQTTKKKDKKKKKKKTDPAPQEDGSWVMVNQQGNKEETTVPSQVEAAGAAPSNETHTVTLNLEPEDKPVLLGSKGATIQGIQQTSGARLDIVMPLLKITGTETAIAIAMEQTQSILGAFKEEQRKAAAHSTTLSGKQINGSDGVKAIIGKGGQNIQSIQVKTGCKLDANVEQAKVVITGPSEAEVQKAATLCKHAVFGESQHVIGLKSVGMVMVVYGKDYQKIRQMQDESGAKLDIEKGTTTLKISGPSEAVARARQMVEAWMEHCKGEEIQIEANKVGAVYGKGGTTIRRIQERTGAFIEVPQGNHSGNVPCKIMGDPAAVKDAKELVLKAVAGEVELKPGEVMEKMDLDIGAPAVIGRGGSKIRELEKTFEVKLTVDSNSRLCRIVGKQDAVTKAKEEIAKIVSPLLEEKRIKGEADRLAEQATATADAGAWGGSLNQELDGW